MSEKQPECFRHRVTGEDYVELRKEWDRAVASKDYFGHYMRCSPHIRQADGLLALDLFFVSNAYVAKNLDEYHPVPGAKNI